MHHWHYPTDPNCPTVARFKASLFNDPMTEAIGAPTDEICEDFDRQHVKTCSRCQAYAAMNVEVSDNG